MVRRRRAANRIGRSAPGHRWRGRRGPHVDLGAEAEAGGLALLVEVEDDPLTLAQHAEYGPLERARGEVDVGPVGVAHDDALTGARVVGLDDALHARCLLP